MGVRVDVSEHSVPGPCGKLDARLFAPRRGPGPHPAPPEAVAATCGSDVALVLHPYGLLGGSQEVMRDIARHLALLGVPALTLNTRGVGGSAGNGTLTLAAEAGDAVAAGEWLAALGFRRVLLLCSSAGCAVGGGALDSLPVFSGCAAFGCTFGWAASALFGRSTSALRASPKPKLFVQGARDLFTSPEQLTAWALPRCRGPVEARVVPNLGHFELEQPAWAPTSAAWVVEWARRVGALGGGGDDAAVGQAAAPGVG